MAKDATDLGRLGRGALSRRGVIAAAAAAPLGLGAAASQSEAAVDVAHSWLAKRAQGRRWMGRWSRLETWLAEQHGWYGLDEAQQGALDAARGLYIIEARLDRLAAEQEVLLERLASSPARSPSEVMAKLAVAMELLAPEDEPQVHRLIADAWRELSATRG